RGLGSGLSDITRADQAPVERIEGSCRATLELQLAQDPADVCFHGLLTNLELARDLLVRLSAGEQSEHACFPFRQAFRTSWNLNLFHQVPEFPNGRRGDDPGPAPVTQPPAACGPSHSLLGAALFQ